MLRRPEPRQLEGEPGAHQREGNEQRHEHHRAEPADQRAGECGGNRIAHRAPRPHETEVRAAPLGHAQRRRIEHWNHRARRRVAERKDQQRAPELGDEQEAQRRGARDDREPDDHYTPVAGSVRKFSDQHAGEQQDEHGNGVDDADLVGGDALAAEPDSEIGGRRAGRPEHSEMKDRSAQLG
jgi:hypothetical protein